jgi:nudix-type nucleoside diphosphatase (YffH/AdpP family)
MMNKLPATDLSERIRVHSVEVLSDDWYLLRKTTFDFLRSDGSWQRQSRETYDRGNGATILLYNLRKKTVILTRQFRYPAFVNGYQELLIEAPAGLLDERSPEEAIRKETAEETGYVIHDVKKVFEAFMSPGSVTEKLYFFVAEYDSAAKQEEGGGVPNDGEDIETIEMRLDDALDKVAAGEIRDGKTIMLLQYARLHFFA